MVLSLAETFHAYNMRSEKPIVRIGVFKNKLLNNVTLISVLLTAFVLFVPGVVTVFGMVYLPWYGYLIGLGLALAAVVIMEIAKLFRRKE